MADITLIKLRNQYSQYCIDKLNSIKRSRNYPTSNTLRADLITYSKELIANNRNSLSEDDYVLDEKEKTIILTEQGVAKAEKFFKIDDISDIQYIELNHHINNALRANYLMKKDSPYRDGGTDPIILLFLWG